MLAIHAMQRLIKAGRETGEGAGALFYCPETENFLILKRSDEGDEPGTWCGLGGGRDNAEPLEMTVRRESFEEAALPMDAEYDLYKVCKLRHDDGFQFTNYLALIAEEFIPVLNDEHSGYQWCKWQDFPPDMHQAMMAAFMSKDGQTLLRQHTTALDNQ